VKQGFTGFQVQHTPIAIFKAISRMGVVVDESVRCFECMACAFEQASCLLSLMIRFGDPRCSFRFRKFGTGLGYIVRFRKIRILFERFQFFLRDSDSFRRIRIFFKDLIFFLSSCVGSLPIYICSGELHSHWSFSKNFRILNKGFESVSQHPFLYSRPSIGFTQYCTSIKLGPFPTSINLTMTAEDDNENTTTTEAEADDAALSASESDQSRMMVNDSSNENTTTESSGDHPYSPSILYCACRHPILCSKCGQAHTDRDHTRKSVQHLVDGIRPKLANVFGNGPLLVSDVPESARDKPGIDQQQQPCVVLGIDEAGRGSVIGSMVYGCAYWSSDPSIEATIPKGFHDSKQLKEDQRERLWEKILDHDHIGFCVRSILPSEISRNMLRKSTDVYNLNEQSHDAAMTMIQKVLDAGVNVTTAYIDTVGIPEHYKRKLEQKFPSIQFVVESKADAKYAPCSAASVVAKVLR
jgi:ribonuclease H